MTALPRPTCQECPEPVARFDGNEYKPIYIDGLGWIGDRPHVDHHIAVRDAVAERMMERLGIGRTAVGETS